MLDTILEHEAQMFSMLNLIISDRNKPQLGNLKFSLSTILYFLLINLIENLWSNDTTIRLRTYLRNLLGET